MRESLLIILLVATGFICSCTKIQTFSPEPEITYKSFRVVDTVDSLGNITIIGYLSFRFIDGDGDIGWEDGDNPPDNPEGRNLFFTTYEMIDGEFVKVSDSLRYSIPYLENEGPNKVVKGEVIVKFNYYYDDYDTIMYEFFMIDRALHQSNIESTPPLVLK